MNKNARALLRAISSVTGNIAAAWFSIALITPGVTGIADINAILVLTRHILLGIVFLTFTILVERKLEE
ncbi:MAG: hypothetical protein A2698_02205 [Candidatus Levybacteria bacterium RIFCSPHIGHO2_01_FULL_42_15]|nr:MAG: hypothetical protein A2698_02205 [Candidatus Levybacteria bacterium RIFCSPHIGHO2_01_FULL_42_15]